VGGVGGDARGGATAVGTAVKESVDETGSGDDDSTVQKLGVVLSSVEEAGLLNKVADGGRFVWGLLRAPSNDDDVLIVGDRPGTDDVGDEFVYS
jgi:hypothetical protein